MNSSLGPRVHAPFTLSETLTCPVAFFWANHPTNKSPFCTAFEKVIFSDVAFVVGEAAAACTKVMPAAFADFSEALPNKKKKLRRITAKKLKKFSVFLEEKRGR